MTIAFYLSGTKAQGLSSLLEVTKLLDIRIGITACVESSREQVCKGQDQGAVWKWAVQGDVFLVNFIILGYFKTSNI